jgi:hypothetical protein
MRTLLLSLFLISNAIGQTTATDELSAFWEDAERQVVEGDYDAYAASFHEEAILVNGMSGNSIPIQVALDGWKQGFDETKNGNMKASVEFRFSENAIGAVAAHQTGIFLYKWQNEGEEEQEVYIHFEALLTKSEGDWKMLMEYQKAIATKEEWDSLN